MHVAQRMTVCMPVCIYAFVTVLRYDCMAHTQVGLLQKKLKAFRRHLQREESQTTDYGLLQTADGGGAPGGDTISRQPLILSASIHYNILFYVQLVTLF